MLNRSNLLLHVTLIYIRRPIFRWFFPNQMTTPVAAFASRTAAMPLLAVADAAVTADAPVGADSVSLAASLLNHQIGDALLTGFIVDDENPLP